MMWRPRENARTSGAVEPTATSVRSRTEATLVTSSRGVGRATPVPAHAAAQSTATSQGGPSGGRTELVAMARLAWALGRTLSLVRLAYVAIGRPADDVAEIETALAQARLPDEYVEIARRVAQIAAPALAASTPQSGAILATFRRALATVARAVLAENVAVELDRLADRYDIQGDGDPAPLLLALQHLAEMVARSRESSDVLHQALDGVQRGIRKIADDEDAAQDRLRASRGRIERADNTTELLELRDMLLAETDRLQGLMSERRASLEALEKQSRSARKRAQRLIDALADATTAAATDILTGLGNRRALDRTVEELDGAGDVGVLMIDIDHFKSVNDTHGHGVGDRVLAHVAEMLQLELRGDDLGFRSGGEEFVVLLHDCDAEGAMRTAERVRARIERTPAAVLGRALSVTVSIGVSAWAENSPFQSALERADAALYDAKHAGRNRCVSSPSPNPQQTRTTC